MKMTDLMIILGAPASGKTTLGRRLAADLALPCLSKDDIKEALFDVLGASDAAASRRLSDASFGAQLRLARAHLGGGGSCILEGNWRAEHAAALSGIVATPGARAGQIGCRAEAGDIARRFISRVRHSGHADASRSAAEIADFATLPLIFLDVPGPRWIYDSGAVRAYDELLHALKSWRL